MTRYVLLGIATAGLAIGQPLHAADTTANLTVNASIAAKASLTIGSAAINFPIAAPTTSRRFRQPRTRCRSRPRLTRQRVRT